MNKRVLVCVAALAMVACDPEVVEPEDGGVGADSGSDASVEVCARNLDCDDGLYCTVHQCMPGVASADARGCVIVDGPCEADMACDEAGERCTEVDCAGSDRDRDGDGHVAIACGGDDCDDDDEFRFVGAGEVCDAEGHDEDCVATTFARASEEDVDGDGFVTDQCCNGASCGDDCAPNDRAIFPGARELCNGRDDDCDGVVDEETDLPLCPGGTCRGGYCDLQAWARTFGGPGGATPVGIAMDDLGNVYIAGTFFGDVAFGGAEGPVSSADGGQFIASYGPDGSYRWLRTFGGTPVSVAFDRVAGQVYVTGNRFDVDFGGGAGSGPYVLALDADGGYEWDFHPCTELTGGLYPGWIEAHDGAYFVGNLTGGCDFGDGIINSPAIGGTFVVVKYRPDGSLDWTYLADASASSEVFLSGGSIDSTGMLAMTGTITRGTVDFGRGPRGADATGGTGFRSFAVVLDASGTSTWDYVSLTAGIDVEDVVIDPSGRAFLVGRLNGFTDEVDFGGGPVTVTQPSGFLVSLDSTGAYDRFNRWGEAGESSINGISLDSANNLLLVGSYSEVLNFGGGSTEAPPGGAAFIAVFDSLLNHRWDRTYTYPGFPGSACTAAAGSCDSSVTGVAVGPADSTALVGTFNGLIDLDVVTRTSETQPDTFLLRLAN